MIEGSLYPTPYQGEGRWGVFCFLLLMTVAVSGFADEDRAVAANNKKNTILAPLHNEKFEYYEVCGCSEKDLQCDLTQKAVKCNDGKKYDSVTNWKVKWDYAYIRDSQVCTTDSFRVAVDIIFRLPKWVRNGDAPQSLVDKWDSYMEKLMMHEYGHRDMALEAASELTRAVSELPPARTCADLDREVRALCRVRMKKLIEDQKVYDETTNHGHTQGAVFP